MRSNAREANALAAAKKFLAAIACSREIEPAAACQHCKKFKVRLKFAQQCKRPRSKARPFALLARVPK
jgi:hypothetical protein